MTDPTIKKSRPPPKPVIPGRSGGRPEAITAVVEQIKPLLANRQPEFQGAVLLDLLAIWLAGHYVAGDPDATRKLRAEMLEAHLVMLDDLVAVNAKIIGTTA